MAAMKAGMRDNAMEETMDGWTAGCWVCPMEYRMVDQMDKSMVDQRAGQMVA